MTQPTDWGVPSVGPATPTVYAARDNEAFDALLDLHSGTSRPAYAISGTVWKDVVSGTEENIYFFDGIDDILLYVIDPTANTVTPTIAAKSITISKIANGTDGELITWNATGVAATVAVGTVGQVLTSGGVGVAPTMQDAGGGAWTFLSTVTVSAAATADIETTFDSTYDAYAIVGTNIVGGAVEAMIMRFKIGGSYAASNYYSHSNVSGSGSTSYVGNIDNAGTSFTVVDTLSNNAGAPTGITIFLPTGNPESASTKKTATWSSWANGGSKLTIGAGTYPIAGALSGVRFLMLSGGNITSATFRLYGINNS